MWMTWRLFRKIQTIDPATSHRAQKYPSNFKVAKDYIKESYTIHSEIFLYYRNSDSINLLEQIRTLQFPCT